MTTFRWSGPYGYGVHNYLCHTDTTVLARATGVAEVRPTNDGCAYRVELTSHLDELVPRTAYILRNRYPTLEAAKRAVERKVPGLVAVLKIHGVQL